MRLASFLFYFITIVLFGTFATAQPLPRKQIKGKVNSSAYDLSGIYIVNKYSRANTTTITEGYFAIDARPGDTLTFSDINFVKRQIAVTKENYDGELIYIRMAAIANQLDEVIVDQYKHINAVTMGILPKQPRSFSKAERALKARGVSDFGLDHPNSFDMGSLLSSISGTRGKLFKNLAVERKLATHDIVENYFSDDFFTKQMKIPEDRVEGFKFYIVESADFSSAIKAGNVTLASWLMAALAIQYNTIEKNDFKLKVD